LVKMAFIVMRPVAGAFDQPIKARTGTGLARPSATARYGRGGIGALFRLRLNALVPRGRVAAKEGETRCRR
jgi:hypothetical protein